MKVVLSQTSKDLTITHRIRYQSSDVALITEVRTTNVVRHNNLKNILKGWDVSQRPRRSPSEYVFEKEQDITRRTVQDVLDEIVTDICDVVTGKKVY